MRKLFTQFIKEDEVVLWKSQKSKKYLDIVILGILLFIIILNLFITMFESHPYSVFVFLFWFVALLIVIIINFREYLEQRNKDEFCFISNRRIGKIKISKVDHSENSINLEEMRIEDLNQIHISYEFEKKEGIIVNFFDNQGRVLKFEEIKGKLNSLRKNIVRYLNIRILEIGQNGEELVLKP